MLGFALLATGAFAQQQVINFDPNRTKVEFTLGDFLHTVHGTFKLKSGNIRFDSATGAASGALIVDASTGESGNKSRDKKMHADVLESRTYPEIVFIPRRVVGHVPQQGSSQVTVEGVLRMHGSERPMTLNVPFSIDGHQVTANTRFDIPYETWGVKNPSTFILRVSNKVQIDIAANGSIAGE
jgi:polyisoprenoid-binding protein YceI